MATKAGAHYVDQAEFDSIMARIAGTARGPTPVMEPMRDPWNGRDLGIQVNRYDRNPLVSNVQALGSATADGGRAPQMFEVGGDLPPFTASGIDPIRLLSVPWRWRHAAALTDDRQLVLKMIQEANEPNPDRWQTAGGRQLFDEYRDRVWSWATTAPDEPDEPVDGEVWAILGRLFPPRRR